MERVSKPAQIFVRDTALRILAGEAAPKTLDSIVAGPHCQLASVRSRRATTKAANSTQGAMPVHAGAPSFERKLPARHQRRQGAKAPDHSTRLPAGNPIHLGFCNED